MRAAAPAGPASFAADSHLDWLMEADQGGQKPVGGRNRPYVNVEAISTRLRVKHCREPITVEHPEPEADHRPARTDFNFPGDASNPRRACYAFRQFQAVDLEPADVNVEIWKQRT